MELTKLKIFQLILRMLLEAKLKLRWLCGYVYNCFPSDFVEFQYLLIRISSSHRHCLYIWIAEGRAVCSRKSGYSVKLQGS